jgi:hypothetical protein
MPTLMIWKNYLLLMTTKNLTAAILHDLDWLSSVIDYAIKSYLKHDGYEDTWQSITYTPYNGDDNIYSQQLATWNLGEYERLALLLTMAPYVRPELLDIFLIKNGLYDRYFTEFGGRTGANFPGFQPTGQTFSFLLSVSQADQFTVLFDTLGDKSRLIQQKIIVLDGGESAADPFLNVPMRLGPEWMHKLILGADEYPIPPGFPAHKITTALSWNDVVFDGRLREEIDEIKNWIKYSHVLMNDWGLAQKIKPGYKSLFYGPPGTGKTLTATLLGAECGLDVYKVDLSLITSKYIGETEKNIAMLFDTAEQKNWLLFFDEADSLFGKRTETASSNDRYANQQVGYLLQRVEDYPGVVILASNLKSNIDDAFTRRFQSVLYFRMPDAEERYLLWTNAFSGTCKLAPDVDLRDVAQQYELSGGSIVNILRTCAITAVARGSEEVGRTDLMAAIRKEFKKSNRNILTV